MEDLAMKKLHLSIIIGVFLILPFSLKASEFTLRMHDHSVFSLTFNNNYFADIQGSITLDNVAPGKQYIKVYKYRTTPSGYVIGMPQLVYEGIIHITSGRAVYAVIDFYGRYFVEKETFISYNYNPYMPYPPPVYIEPYMNDKDFADLKHTIFRQSFESSKLALAKQAIDYNTVTSLQVFEIMNMFSFESSKLDFAKYAFHKVYDPQKYYIVNNAFTFSSSISSLDKYIKGL